MIGREPAMRISTSLLALCCQSGLDATLETTGSGKLYAVSKGSDERIQRRGDDLLRCDVVNEQQHPASQRFNRGHGLSELPLRCG